MSGYPDLDYVSMNVCDFLQGKDKPSYTPWKEDGDIVVVTNAKHVVLTGKKWDQKLYRWHTGYSIQHHTITCISVVLLVHHH